MTRSAQQTVELFWQSQSEGDVRQLLSLFADDAVFEDPHYGRFVGVQAITEFLGQAAQAMATQKSRFSLQEVVGSGDVAWARWTAHRADGEFSGCAVYRVVEGRITYLGDYMTDARLPQSD